MSNLSKNNKKTLIIPRAKASSSIFNSSNQIQLTQDQHSVPPQPQPSLPSMKSEINSQSAFFDGQVRLDDFSPDDTSANDVKTKVFANKSHPVNKTCPVYINENKNQNVFELVTSFASKNLSLDYETPTNPESTKFCHDTSNTTIAFNSTCPLGFIEGYGFTISGTLPSHLFAHLEQSTSDSERSLNYTGNSPPLKISLSITTHDSKTYEIPVSLTNLNSTHHQPSTMTYSQLAPYVISKDEITTPGMMEPGTYAADLEYKEMVFPNPKCVISPMSNFKSYQALTSSTQSTVIDEQYRQLFSVLDLSYSFSPYQLARGSYRQSSFITNWLGYLNSDASKPVAYVSFCSTSDPRITPYPCHCTAPVRELLESPNAKSIDVSDCFPTPSPIAVNDFYDYPSHTSSKTFLTSYIRKGFIPDISFDSCPSQLSLETKHDASYAYGTYVTFLESNISGVIYRFRFYEPTERVNLETSFPSVRQSVFDQPLVCICLFSASDQDNTLIIPIHSVQDNLIFEFPSTNSMGIPVHLRLKNIKFTNLTHHSTSSDSMLTNICDTISNYYTLKSDPCWPVPTTIPPCVSFNKQAQLPKFVTSPQESIYGSNIMTLINHQLTFVNADPGCETVIRDYFSKLLSYASTFIGAQFKCSRGLPVFSRSRYTNYFSRAPRFTEYINKYRSDRTVPYFNVLSSLGLTPINSLPTFMSKALQSRRSTIEKNRNTTKYGFGYNNFMIPYDQSTDASLSTIIETPFVGKCYTCEFCNLMYPTYLGSLFCKACHIITQSIFVFGKEDDFPRSVYTHYLLPHVRQNHLASVAIGESISKQIYSTTGSKVFKLYPTHLDYERNHNCITVFVMRHNYDVKTGEFINTTPFDTKVDVTPFLTTRPSPNSSFELKVFANQSRQSRATERSTPTKTPEATRQRSRSTSRMKHFNHHTNSNSYSIRSNSKTRPSLDPKVTNDYTKSWTLDDYLSANKDRYNRLAARTKEVLSKVKFLPNTDLLLPEKHELVHNKYTAHPHRLTMDSFSRYINVKKCSDSSQTTVHVASYFSFASVLNPDLPTKINSITVASNSNANTLLARIRSLLLAIGLNVNEELIVEKTDAILVSSHSHKLPSLKANLSELFTLLPAYTFEISDTDTVKTLLDKFYSIDNTEILERIETDSKLDEIYSDILFSEYYYDVFTLLAPRHFDLVGARIIIIPDNKLKGGLHAEMKILENPFTYNEFNNYLSISGMCCPMCHLYLRNLNIKCFGSKNNICSSKFWIPPNIPEELPNVLKFRFNQFLNRSFKDLNFMDKDIRNDNLIKQPFESKTSRLYADEFSPHIISDLKFLVSLQDDSATFSSYLEALRTSTDESLFVKKQL